MAFTSFAKKVSTIALSAACCVALVGCGGTNYGYTGGTAATVNGVEIKEDTITKYVQDFRTSYEITTNDTWAQWLVENSFTPEDVRNQVIDYYVDLELEKQAAAENNITVDAAQVDEQITAMKANYSSDSEWQNALSTMGITEEEYRASIEEGLRQAALQEAVVDVSVDDKELLEWLTMYSSMFENSKKSSHILFEAGDTETAQDVLNQINSGKLDFAEAAEKYSTDTASAIDGGNVGWNTLNSFVDEYTTALDGLKKGQVSELVTSDFGIHIIKCTDTFNPAGNENSVDDFPTEFIDYMKQIIQSNNEATAFDTWFADYKAQATVEINDMPDNVPYNLDMTQYDSATTVGTEQTTEGEEESSETTTE